MVSVDICGDTLAPTAREARWTTRISTGGRRLWAVGHTLACDTFFAGRATISTLTTVRDVRL